MKESHLFIASNTFIASGPCTDMVIDELCANSITSTVSGWYLNPSAVAKNCHPLRCSGMETRIHAEVGHRVAQMRLTRKEANRIVLKLVEGYEKRIPEAPIGKVFNECYQMDKIRPTDEYETLYEKRKKKWNKMGLEGI